MGDKIIFDLDGVLADNTHRLHWITGEKKYWDEYTDACVSDTPITEMVKVYTMHINKGDSVYILTGRSARVRGETEQWLETHDIKDYTRLIMRPEDCYLKDHELKRLWITMHGISDAVMGYDDLAHNITMLTELGIVGVLVKRI